MKRETAIKYAREIARRVHSVNGLLATPGCRREAVRIRRVIGQSLLALARKEISAADLTAMAKAADSIANTLNAEISLAKTSHELRKTGADLGQIVHIWRTTIGGD